MLTNIREHILHVAAMHLISSQATWLNMSRNSNLYYISVLNVMCIVYSVLTCVSSLVFEVNILLPCATVIFHKKCAPEWNIPARNPTKLYISDNSPVDILTVIILTITIDTY